MTTTAIGRLLRSSTIGFVFGCSVPEPDVPCFGDFVKAPAQRQQSEVIGLIYDIAIEDDPFVRQMAATPNLPEAYILDQRENRQVPIEVSVLAVGYRQGRDTGAFFQTLPPQPPITLDQISLCEPGEVSAFNARLDYLGLILAAPDIPADELLGAALRNAATALPPTDRRPFLLRAGQECARLLCRDLVRLDNVLRKIRQS
jgi:hypothetical protein